MSTVTDFTSVEDQAGTSLENASGLEDVIQRAGFDFEVEKAALYNEGNDELDGFYALRREDTKEVMNVVRGRYQPVHNRQMFEPFDQMVRDFGATYENAGLVRGGRTCWISAKLPGEITVNGKDKLEQRIVGMAHHDGTKRNSYFQFTKRIWCNNMLRMLQSEANKRGHHIRHTTKWQEHLEKAREGFNSAVRAASAFGGQAEQLADHALGSNQAECFLQNLYPIIKEDSKQKITRTNNRREHVTELFHNGKGNEGKTRWDMLNAVTEYYDHHVGNKKSTPSSRFMSNMSGYGPDRVKQQAFRLLLNTDKFLTLDPKLN
jgi:phage/plasmid-like protein (TIGR03299 family)